MKLNFDAMVLSCIDPRFQPKIYNYLRKRKLNGKYSSFTIAGAAIGVTASKFKKWHKTFWDNIDTSIKLHKIKRAVLHTLHEITQYSQLVTYLFIYIFILTL